MDQIIRQRLAEHMEVLQKLSASDMPLKLEKCAKIVERALAEGHKVLFCGNGGSAADSQHLAAEFVGRFQKERIRDYLRISIGTREQMERLVQAAAEILEDAT